MFRIFFTLSIQFLHFLYEMMWMHKNIIWFNEKKILLLPDFIYVLMKYSRLTWTESFVDAKITLFKLSRNALLTLWQLSNLPVLERWAPQWFMYITHTYLDLSKIYTLFEKISDNRHYPVMHCSNCKHPFACCFCP